ncbi:MAG: GNAT family N-acetyltransferase [Bdellovibrionales bacterium]
MTTPILGHAALFCSDICGDNETEILLYLRREFWRQGYATEAGKLMIAFAEGRPEICTVKATLDMDHVASIRICEKIGMHLLRKGCDEMGEFLVYGLSLRRQEC